MCFLLGSLHQGCTSLHSGHQGWKTQLEEDFKIHPCALGQGQLLFPHSWEKPDLVLAIETPHAACCSALVSVLLEGLQSVQSELFPGKLSSLHFVLLPGIQRTMCCFSMLHDRIDIYPFLGVCIFRVLWVTSWVTFLRSFLFISPLHFLVCVCVYFTQWLLNRKCGHVKSFFWHLWKLQVVETSTRARISPQLFGPFCPLWNACGKKSCMNWACSS